MSSSLTLQQGQTFDGSPSVGAGHTGQITAVEAGTVRFNTTYMPQPFASLEVTQDILSQGPSVGGFTINSIGITSVLPATPFSMTTADLPPGVGFPAGFPGTINTIGTVVTLSVSESFLGNSATITTGTAHVIGTDGTLVLLGDLTIAALFSHISMGDFVLSAGVQNAFPAAKAVADYFGPTITTACYAAGSRILTEHGEAAVETLAVGERVATASGRLARILWLGHREVNCAAHPNPEDVWPVRVRADAFGPGMPHTDLLLSPDHAVFTGGVLIPIRYLINGTSIAQEPCDTLTYWHVELARHDVLLAQGLPAESYLDTGNRDAFAGEAATALHPEFDRSLVWQSWDERACAPLALGGPPLARIRAALAERSAATLAKAGALSFS